VVRGDYGSFPQVTEAYCSRGPLCREQLGAHDSLGTVLHGSLLACIVNSVVYICYGYYVVISSSNYNIFKFSIIFSSYHTNIFISTSYYECIDVNVMIYPEGICLLEYVFRRPLIIDFSPGFCNQMARANNAGC
jgi:hypothetical protein